MPESTTDKKQKFAGHRIVLVSFKKVVLSLSVSVFSAIHLACAQVQSPHSIGR